MQSMFKHPKVYDDLTQFYRMYWQTHRHLPRPFRMTTGEAILQEVTACIKGVILANQGEKTEVEHRAHSAGVLGDVRARLVVIRGLLTVGWAMTFIAHGSFMRMTTQLDEVEKQVTRWQHWFTNAQRPH